MILVGKNVLKDEMENVERKKGKGYRKILKSAFFETSALSGVNIS